MRELPALFSTPMVQAILENRKRMTRRTQGLEKMNIIPETFYLSGEQHTVNSKDIAFIFKPCIDIMNIGPIIVKPKYNKGDHIWVKETYYAYGYWDETGYLTKKKGQTQYEFIDLTVTRNYKYLFETDTEKPNKILNNNAVVDGLYGWFKRSSLFMPKVDARIWLEVTNVRCERLQDITEADAIAEGILSKVDETGWDTIYQIYLPDAKNWWAKNPIESFSSLWEMINGQDAWLNNPWVFVYEFKRISKEICTPDQPTCLYHSCMSEHCQFDLVSPETKKHFGTSKCGKKP